MLLNCELTSDDRCNYTRYLRTTRTRGRGVWQMAPINRIGQ